MIRDSCWIKVYTLQVIHTNIIIRAHLKLKILDNHKRIKQIYCVKVSYFFKTQSYDHPLWTFMSPWNDFPTPAPMSCAKYLACHTICEFKSLSISSVARKVLYYLLYALLQIKSIFDSVIQECPCITILCSTWNDDYVIFLQTHNKVSKRGLDDLGSHL